MNYDKKEFLGGKWADREELFDKKTSKGKIVSETNPEPSKYTNEDGTPKMQDVCLMRFPEYPDAMKVSLNQSTINALVDAFGNDSKNWQDKLLGVEIQKFPGKKYYLYLVPTGYKLIEDEKGYGKVIKIGAEPMKKVAENDEVHLDPSLDDVPVNEDIPF